MAKRSGLPFLGDALGKDGDAIAQQSENQRRGAKVERAADKERKQFQLVRRTEGGATEGLDEWLTVVMRDIQITGWHVVAGGAVTANDTNYARIELDIWKQDGSAADTLATATTKTKASGGTGNWVSARVIEFPKPPERKIARGQSIRFDIDKFGTGVTLPDLVLVVEYTELD